MTKKIDRQQAVDDAIASFKLEDVTVSDYCKSQLDEYLAGRMTHKMMLQMMDECYIEEVIKEYQDGKTVTVDIGEL
jgi:hypothetical protein|tara:strand:- start:224 stop:451 length:228 start_codon:yes stop_codon:yes gene_type:complete